MLTSGTYYIFSTIIYIFWSDVNFNACACGNRKYKTQSITSAVCIFHYFSYVQENAALRKPAWQKHNWPDAHYDVEWGAAKAVDGMYTDRAAGGNQCTLSGPSQTTAMWRVDLESMVSISHINIYYRTDNVPSTCWCFYLAYLILCWEWLVQNTKEVMCPIIELSVKWFDCKWKLEYKLKVCLYCSLTAMQALWFSNIEYPVKMVLLFVYFWKYVDFFFKL